METLIQDVRYAVRTLIKQPVFSLVAVVSLALGIGATSAIFEVVNAVLIRPLPYKDPDRLVLVRHSYSKLKLFVPVSAPGYVDYTNQSSVFDDTAVFAGWNVNLTGSGEPERLLGRRVSARLFPTLGIAPVAGREFLAEEDQPGYNRVVMISHGLWSRRFGADQALMGTPITLNGESYTVVGVLPPASLLPAPQLLGQDVEVYTPIALTPQQLSNAQRGQDMLGMVARLKKGVLFSQAQAEMDLIADHVKEANPGVYPDEWGVSLKLVEDETLGGIKSTLLVLSGAVGLLLVIACANVASLLLASGAERQRELSIRIALGATRRRLIRQLLTESVLISVAGGAIGLGVAYWGVDLLVAMNRTNIPRAKEISPDLRAIGFTLLVSLITGIIFGLVPALQASKIDLNGALKEGVRATFGARQRKLRSVLVISELAFALMLLIGAGLMVKSFRHLLEVSPGFNPQSVLTTQLALPTTKYRQQVQVVGFYRDVVEKVKRLPGVESASAVSNLPLSGTLLSGNFTIQGRPPLPPGEVAPFSDRRAITPDYFRTMEIPLFRGRFFADQDNSDAPLVAIIDEVLASAYWSNEDPVGKHLSFENDGNKTIWREIVGLVGHVKHRGLDKEVRGHLYIPHAQINQANMSIVARTSVDPMSLATAITGEIRSVDPELPIYNVKSLEDYLYGSVSERRFSMWLFTLFAAVAIILASVGLYGLISYSVAQRTHEIGVRIAIGAEPNKIVWLIIRQGMLLVMVGVLIGVSGAFALTRLMTTLLFQVRPTDPVIFVAVAIVLGAVSFAASAVPAFRATRIDPLSALREE